MSSIKYYNGIQTLPTLITCSISLLEYPNLLSYQPEAGKDFNYLYSANFKSLIRLKCLVLLVTNVNPFTKAVAAINKSKSSSL